MARCNAGSLPTRYLQVQNPHFVHFLQISRLLIFKHFTLLNISVAFGLVSMIAFEKAGVRIVLVYRFGKQQFAVLHLEAWHNGSH